MARLENKIEKAIQPLLEMYEEIENDLLIKIAGHFSINDEFLNSDYWRIKKIEEMGLFNQEIVDYIARYSNKTKKEVLKALNQIGIDTMNLNNLNRLFEDEVLKINPNILKNNYTINNIINTAYNELSNRFIQMSKQIEEATRNTYLNIVEKTYLETTMGTHSYQESIQSAIDQLSNKGINTLDYKVIDDSGKTIGVRHYDITSTVRRETLTATRQLSNNINMAVANELECEYLYLSEHIRCRPEHFDWQGTIIKREDLVKVTDYGSITGLAGINCAHYFEPYFGDARGDELKKISKDEATYQYELSQKQRYLERGVRKWKRKAEMFKANEDIVSFEKSKDRVKKWQLRLKNFTENNELKRDYTREYVKESKVSFFKEDNDTIIKKYKSMDENIEHMMLFDMNTGKQIGRTIHGSVNKIDLSLKTYLTIKRRKKDSLLVVHNHPNNSSFSFTDIKTFNNMNSIGAMAIISEKYIYLLSTGKNGKIKLSTNEWDTLKKYYDSLYNKTKHKYSHLDNIERTNIVNKKFFEKLGWEYERHKNIYR